MSTLLKAEKIIKSYGRGQVEETVLKGLSASFGANEWIAITGPSGSGKSTFLHLLGLMDSPTDGKVFFEDRDISKCSEDEIDEIRRTQLGFIFQTFNLFSAFSARENVEFSLLGIEPNDEARIERAFKALESVGMAEHANKMPKQLSGGQRQRVAIARAFVHRPPLIIADEPTASLDKQHSIEVIDILKRMHSEMKTTIIMASHDQLVYSQAQKILRIEGDALSKLAISQKMKWQIAIRNVLRHRKRSLVCMMTIAAGVASLLVFEGFNDGAMWTYQERVVHSRLGHIQITKNVKEGTLTTDVKESLIKNPDEIRAYLSDPKTGLHLSNSFPRMTLSGLITNNIRTVPVMAEGIDPEVENPFFYEMEYITGNALNPKASDGVILGKGVADALGVKVGDRVTLLGYTLSGSLNAADLVVAGTFSGGVQIFDESYIRLSLKAAQDLLQTDGVTAISVGLSNSSFTQSDLERINANLPKDLSAQSFDIIDNVYYGNAMRWLKAQFFFIRMIIFMIVILGILNTVNITIHERTSEIGTLRAMGFSKEFIKWQFLREYAFLGLMGAVSGLGLAFFIDKLVLYNGFPMPPSPGATKGLQVDLRIGLFAIGLNMSLAVVLSMIATYWPARRGSRLSIVEALGYKI